MAKVFRVTGPPGTGKTAFLRRQVETWTAGGTDPQDIVLCSLTKAAAGVLAGRVEVPRRNVATLHSLAYNGLGRPTLAEVGAVGKEWNARTDIGPHWKFGDEHGSLDEAPVQGHGERMAQYNLARALMFPKEHPLWVACADFATAWEGYKRDNEAMDFADLITVARQDLPAAPGEPSVLIADESQDFSPSQWDLLRAWADHPSVDRYMVAGDPAQTLYAWVGSRPDEMLADLPAERQIMLSQSHRLPVTVQAFAERWLRLHHSVGMMEGRDYRPRDAEGAVRRLPATWRAPTPLVHAVQQRLEGGGRVMVLAPARYLLRPFLALAREVGIPFANPYRKAAGDWNPLGSVRRDATVSTVDRLYGFLHPPWTAEVAERWLVMLNAKTFRRRGLRKQIEVGGLISIPDVLPTVDGRYVPASLTPLFERVAIEAIAARDLDWLASRTQRRFTNLIRYGAAIVKRSGAETLRTVPRLVVGTIHSVKGGEADCVFVLPDLSLGAWRAAHRSIDERDATVRTAYVGATRAREELVLCTPFSERAIWW